jgi:methylmalonyl-CoA mutase C-terminal domain/subunit
MHDVLLTGGGIIGDDEIEELMGMGVGQLYGPGSSLLEAADYIKNWYALRKSSDPFD